jgi:hypothetical protein
MRRIFGSIAVVLSTVLLTTGCIKLEMDMTVAADDTVSGTMVFAVAKSLAELSQEGSDGTPTTDNLFEGNAFVKAEPYDDGEFTGSSYIFQGIPMSEFKPDVGDGSGFAIERQGDNIVVSGVLDTSSQGEELESNPFAESILETIAETTSIRVSITLPGEIIETNGQVEGQTITWNGAFGEKLELQAVAVSPLSLFSNLILIGAIVLGVLIVGIVLAVVIRNRKKPKLAQEIM